MNAIVAVTKDWGIGLNNDLLIPNRQDMRHFVELTRGGTVIMGRKTLESFPGGPLKGRRNLVVSHNAAYTCPGAETFTSLEAALEAARAAGTPEDEIWLIGGASLYNTGIDLCKRAYVTLHDTVVPADTYFPNLDARVNWTQIEHKPQGTTERGIPFSFAVYEQVSESETA